MEKKVLHKNIFFLAIKKNLVFLQIEIKTINDKENCT